MWTTGAFIQAVKDTGLVGGRIWRHSDVPADPTFPYVTVVDPVANNPTLMGDGNTLARRRRIQLDVWQLAKQEKNQQTLVGEIERSLDKAQLVSDDQVLGCRHLDTNRAFEPDADVLHHALEFQVDLLVPSGS